MNSKDRLLRHSSWQSHLNAPSNPGNVLALPVGLLSLSWLIGGSEFPEGVSKP